MKKKMNGFRLLFFFVFLTVAMGGEGIIPHNDPGVSGSPGGGSGYATGHLDWDATDQVWRCVGSPLNCAF